jgi:hypothetical protein
MYKNMDIILTNDETGAHFLQTTVVSLLKNTGMGETRVDSLMMGSLE